MLHLPQFRPGSLALKLAGYIIVFSSVIAIGITLAELTLDYYRDVKRIDSRMTQIETAYLDSIVENLWVADKERLETQLSGIIRLPDFVQAEIRVEGKTLLMRGHALREAGVTHTFALQRLHRGQMQNIGELVVAASYHSAFERVMGRLLFFLLANTAKTTVVALFIFFIFYRLLGRHIQTIAAYAREQSRKLSAPPLQLNRPAQAQDDELSELVGAINYLRQDLLQLGQLQQQRAEDIEKQAALLKQELLARKKLQGELNLMALVFQSSSEAIMLTDAQNRILAVNEAFTEMTGYRSQDVIGNNPRMLSAGRTDPQVYRHMWETLREKGAWQGELWDQRKDGVAYPKWLSITAVYDESQQLTHYIGIFSDISERKQAEVDIYRLAHLDTLTGLANRVTLHQELERSLHQARRNKSELAVMFIDLDRFKSVNDVFGHDVGDQLLIEVAQRLQSSVRGSDIVARLGGDEFVVVLPEVEGPIAMARIADKMRDLLAQPYMLEGQLHQVTPSIGLAIYPMDGDSADVLMKNADTAMYHAKALGRNNTQFFTPSMEKAARDRINIERDLRQAIELGQFELHYQAQISGKTGQAVGVEALLRWHHPVHGLVPPAKFIPIAEDTGFIQPLGEWVIHEACRQLRAWKDQGLGQITMGVNLSVLQLSSTTLLEFVGQTLKKFGLTEGDFELEISESGVMKNAEASIGKLQALRDMGVKLSIDDFGTGYSSLSYLQRLPIHALKLDQTFVRNMERESGSATICYSTISLAHGLGLTVVAEGVETDEQRQMLVKRGCDVLQGYWFSKPVSADEAFAFLALKPGIAPSSQ